MITVRLRLKLQEELDLRSLLQDIIDGEPLDCTAQHEHQGACVTADARRIEVAQLVLYALDLNAHDRSVEVTL